LGESSFRSVKEFLEGFIAKPDSIELPGCEPIPILYEDRSVLAIDKPRGWMLAPVSWQQTARNLPAAIESSIAAGDFWARSRGLKFLRHVHRLDADTSGVLLFAKSPGAVKTYSDLFESRRMEKTYLAVVCGKPKETEWICRLRLAPDPKRIGWMKVEAHGKGAETHFRVLQNLPGRGSRGRSPHQTREPHPFTLVEAKLVTGRTHQIRVHLAESGLPIVGDELYGKKTRDAPLGLRAVRLAYVDPFTKQRVEIHAPTEEFLREYGFA
jgi:23S rRNA pseudouridine1911/1915/1917 synthase